MVTYVISEHNNERLAFNSFVPTKTYGPKSLNSNRMRWNSPKIASCTSALGEYQLPLQATRVARVEKMPAPSTTDAEVEPRGKWKEQTTESSVANTSLSWPHDTCNSSVIGD